MPLAFSNTLNNQTQTTTPTGVLATALNNKVQSPTISLPAPKPVPINNIQRTPSGGTVQYINGGTAYSNPLDNPNYKPPVTQPVQQPIVNTSSTPQQTQQLPMNQTSQPTFPGLVGQTANAAQGAYNQGANTTQQASSGLLTSLANNQALAKRAQDIASAAGQQISNIGGEGARGEAGYLTTGTSPVGEGNAAVKALATAAQQQAVAQGANMALQGTAQGLTAQGQTQQGYGTAGGLGTTGQGQGISGLGTAAGLAAPGSSNYSVTPGTSTYNALNPTGQPLATGNVQVPVTNPVQIINPQTGEPVGSPTGSPFSGGEVQGNVQLGQQYAQNVSAFNQAGAVKNQITDYLAQNPTLNPSNF